MSLLPSLAGEAIVLEGEVSNVVYHDAQSHYAVFRVFMHGEAGLSTWVGHTRQIEAGFRVKGQGVWTVHATHGQQFSFSQLTVQPSTSLIGIQRRLEKYPGLGSDRVQKLVKHFGADALMVLEQEPKRYLEIPGIGPKTLERILTFHNNRQGPVAEIEDALFELGLPAYHAAAIVRRYPEDGLQILRTNPYRLARDIRGIGFITADRIARALGVGQESEERVEAGILYAIEKAEADGHCALPFESLKLAAIQLLSLQEERIRDGIERLVAQQELIVESLPQSPSLFFPSRWWNAENHIAQALVALSLESRRSWSLTELPQDLSAGQIEVVQAVAQHGVVILTGGPGTGKSTVTREIIALAKHNNCQVLLAAPTGRAAKRLAEATACPAQTIHRLLEIQPHSGTFTYHANHPLPVGLVIIDEASMLDAALAEALFTALTPQHRLLLVGDVEQLPSVGPGNILRDLIKSAKLAESSVQVVRLQQIFRQSEGSSIITNAHRILHGQALEVNDSPQDGQFFVIPCRDSRKAHELVVRVATERVPKAYGLDPQTDVQILCPMHKGQVGTEMLNQTLQAMYNRDQPELALASAGGSRFYRVGDRVMQTRNDYELGVFNGDVGRVTAVDQEPQRMWVEMDGRVIAYEQRQIASLRLAYAVSIHKSQGSEFPAVIIPLLGEHHVMLRRNLLYTAVTRACQLCVIVGDPKAISLAIRRSDASRRYTGLEQRIQQALQMELGQLAMIPMERA